MTERDEQILHLITNHCNKIEEYLSQVDSLDEFLNNQMIMDAVSLRVLTVGELVKRLPMEFREEATKAEKNMGVGLQTDWKGLAGIRDYVAHQYDNLDFDIIYETALLEMPQLKETCKYMLNEKEKHKRKQVEFDDFFR